MAKVNASEINPSHLRLGGLMLALFSSNIWIYSGLFQTFAPPGWVDPGIYTGHSIDLPGSIARFGASYFSMRLPFTAVTYGLFQLFGPETAVRLTVLFFNSLAITSIYLLVVSRTSVIVAVFCTWWMALNPIWISAVTRFYVDGPAMAYALISLALFDARNRMGHGNPVIFLSGVFAGLALFTNPVASVPLGLGLLALAWIGDGGVRRIASEALIGLAGVICCALAVSALSVSFGGDALFFLTDRNAYKRSFDGGGAHYRYPLSEWAVSAYAYSITIAFLLISLVVLYRRGMARNSPLLVTGLVMTTGTLFLMVAFDHLVGGALIQSSFYASFLLLGQVFIVCGLVEGAPGSRDDAPPPYQWVVGAALFCFAALLVSQASLLWGVLDGSWFAGWPLWFCLIALFVCAALLIPRRAPVLMLACLCLITVLAGVANKDTRRTIFAAGDADFATIFRATIEFHDFVSANSGPASKTYFWFQRSDLNDFESKNFRNTLYRFKFRDTIIHLNYWDSLVAMWMWSDSMLGADMPSISSAELHLLQRSQKPIVLFTICLETTACISARTSLTKAGFLLREKARASITSGHVPLTSVAYEISKTN